jgi:hydroxyethylthiazole kinase-like uncharacterized protein yjeF
LYDLAGTRCIEAQALAALPPNTLMQRAGLAVAQLALAVAPHARRIWIACGPGNNGGDGLEAALHLCRWGKTPVVTWLGSPEKASPDTLAAYNRLKAHGITVSESIPPHVDLCIDALLGIGATRREPAGSLALWMDGMNRSGALVLSVDVPSGLHADTGSTTGCHVKATHTLSLLTLKPGLFTFQGRDACGDVWLDGLGVDFNAPGRPSPTARLNTCPDTVTRQHASHKGNFGDVAVIGGASGMKGAAMLAASAALHAGAGRVFVSLLDNPGLAVNLEQPELMFRNIDDLNLNTSVTVCGCGGGTAIRLQLPNILSASAPVVIDADALNAIATDQDLQRELRRRSTHNLTTVMTPHPLEAARLLGLTAQQVQQDRLAAANRLATSFGCTVILKGSGTVIAGPGQIPVLNATGNARLATAGTGDVLAGMVGAYLAKGQPAFQATCAAVYAHGAIADAWQSPQPLTASQLARGSA